MEEIFSALYLGIVIEDVGWFAIINDKGFEFIDSFGIYCQNCHIPKELFMDS